MKKRKVLNCAGSISELNLSVEQTMAVAQKLYEAGKITYPLLNEMI